MLYPLGGEVVAAALTMEVARLLPDTWSPLAVARLLPDTWSPLADDIITWGAVIAAAAVIWSKVIRPAAQRLALLQQIWDRLQHEFEPNIGSSLRDAVDRTDLRLAELNDRFDDLEIHIERVDKKLAQHMADVKDNGEAS